MSVTKKSVKKIQEKAEKDHKSNTDKLNTQMNELYKQVLDSFTDHEKKMQGYDDIFKEMDQALISFKEVIETQNDIINKIGDDLKKVKERLGLM
jgi:signal recognition particle GTPase